jgi:hypothetical protein
MGIPMDDLHTPTVASGPTTDARTADEKYSKKLSLLELMSEKDRVEGELKALGSVLDSVRVTCFIPSSSLSLKVFHRPGKKLPRHARSSRLTLDPYSTA